jgi:cell division protease FtsH
MSNPRLAASQHKQSRLRAGLSRLGELVAAVARKLTKDPFSVILALASIALIVAFFSLLNSTRPQARGDQVDFSQISTLASGQHIVSATLYDYDHQVTASTDTHIQLYADYPSSDAATLSLLQTLQRGGTQVGVDLQRGKHDKILIDQALIPIVLLVCLFVLFTRQRRDGSGGIAGFSTFRGRGRKRRKKGQAAAITFDSVAGAGEAVAELREIRDFLDDPSKYLDAGAAAPKGVLLVGPPGTGKTLLARATAGEADAMFFSASGAEFVESLVGVGAARIRDLFARARRVAPAIVFIDELDAAGRKRGAGVGQGNDEREQTLNQLLVEMDGFGGDAGIVVMAATNRPDILDPALLRPGRFDRQVVVDVPDVHGRVEILELHAQGRQFGPDADLTQIARLTPGFSGAELANVINEAALLSVRNGEPEIDQATLEEAVDRVIAGPTKRHVLSEEEEWRIAIHESSHAVVARAIGQTTSVQKLSVVARGRQLGTAAEMLTDRDAVLRSDDEMHRTLTVILAGAAGETLEFGGESSGLADDLHAATALARRMVTSYGMSERLGHVAIGEPGGEVFLGASLQDLGSIAPETLNIVDGEIERFVDQAESRAEWVLRHNWAALQEVARTLAQQETLSGESLNAVLSTVREIPFDEIPFEIPDADARRHGEPESH